MTGAALQALAVTGRARGAAARRAVAYLRRQQNRDGGFPQKDGRESNSQSTSYAVQGLAGRARRARRRRARLTYIRRRQRGDGSVAYSASSTQTPVWVTAQALMALRRVPLPVAAVPRAPKPKPAADPSEAAREAQGGRQEAGGRRRTGHREAEGPRKGRRRAAATPRARARPAPRARPSPGSPPASSWTGRAGARRRLRRRRRSAAMGVILARHGGARRARSVQAAAAETRSPALD